MFDFDKEIFEISGDIKIPVDFFNSKYDLPSIQMFVPEIKYKKRLKRSIVDLKKSKNNKSLF